MWRAMSQREKNAQRDSHNQRENQLLTNLVTQNDALGDKNANIAG